MQDLAKITKAMNYFQTHSIEIGILGTGGTITTKNGSLNEITVLEYGTYLEFGTSKMQPFGYIRNAIYSNQEVIQNKVDEIINEVLDGNLNGRPACIQLGEFIRGLVVESILNARSWARPINLRYKKWKTKAYPNRANQTLIKDGFLIKSIRYQIKKGSEVVEQSKWVDINI